MKICIISCAIICIILFISCRNLIYGKNFVPEIWAEMFEANQIGGFFNQPYLQSRPMKFLDFLHVDKNLHKLRIFWVGLDKIGFGYWKNGLIWLLIFTEFVL